MTHDEKIEAWAAALESGRYQQTTGALHDKVGYCCLGVLCEVARESGLPVTVKDTEHGVNYDGEYGVLPQSVREWAGIRTNDAEYQRGGDDYYSLTGLNDDGTCFEHIAAIIKSKPPGLFT